MFATRFGRDWTPRLVKLNPLEIKARDIWHHIRPLVSIFDGPLIGN